ncbi:MAG: adenylyl-sulfate kinase [Chloroflexi bacterium]|nr:adenylyl-sulfate kinase [Chloroflexota bacterium]
MAEDNIFPHLHQVDQNLRSGLKNQHPVVIWLTGLSGSGKSTIANALEYRLANDYRSHTYLLDGDNIRKGLNAGLGFSDEDRKENIRRVGEVSKILYNAGLIVITAFISPFRADREMVRGMIEPGAFWEVFVSCPLEVCMQRDPKGLYRKALKGEISEFTGITSPYEEPLAPELQVKSDQYSVDECVAQIIGAMLEKQIIKQPG